MTPNVLASTLSVPAKMGQTIGESGTLIMGGIITGEEYNSRLQGKYALRMYDIMRKSEESVRASLQMVKLPLINQTNTVNQAGETTKADFRKRFLERELFHRNIDFDKLKREGLTFADFGHSVCEVTYELTMFEGMPLIGIKEIGFRKQTSIEAWETKDHKPGITQMLIGNTKKSVLVNIPRQKLMVWTNDQEGDNYDGISLLRYAFRSWDTVDKLGLIHVIGLEKMAIPTPVLTPPKQTNPADESKAIESIRQYRSNQSGYIKKPFGWELDKFDLSGQSISELLPALQHYEMKIMLSVLGQFLMLGTNSAGGSRAVSADHSKLFMLSEEAFSKTFVTTVQRDLINTLEYLNFSDIEETGYSTLSASAVRGDDVQMLADAVNKLKSAALITPTYDTENHLRKIMKLPELPEDYQEDYDKRRQMANEPPPDPIADPVAPADPKAKDAKTKAALQAARAARSQLLDVILN